MSYASARHSVTAPTQCLPEPRPASSSEVFAASPVRFAATESASTAEPSEPPAEQPPAEQPPAEQPPAVDAGEQPPADPGNTAMQNAAPDDGEHQQRAKVLRYRRQ